MRYLFLFILCSLFFQVFGQVEIESEINIEADKIYSDNFDNLYVLSENIIYKYDSEEKKTRSYQPEGGEEIKSVDVRNPFKIILFFADQNKVILLDNELTQIGDDLYLDKSEILGDILICNATTGGFWVYYNINSQLLKLNPDFSLEYKKYMDISEDLISITENASTIIFQKKSRAFIAYDINTGNVENLAIYKASESYRFINDDIVFYSGNIHGLTFYNRQLSKYNYIKLPTDISITDAVFGKTKVFFFNKTKVYISSVKED